MSLPDKTGQKFVLFMNPRSPFARRIRIALHRLQIDYLEKDVGNVFDAQEELSQINPLGMIPTLMSEFDGPISDSANIIEYLDENWGSLWPMAPSLRQQVRQASTWCQGIMQSAVLFVQEWQLHDQPSPRWLSEYTTSIQDTLLHLSKLNSAVWISQGQLTQAGWDLVVALEYLDFRMPNLNWRSMTHFEGILEIARNESYFKNSKPYS